LTKEMNLAFEVSSFILGSDVLHAVKYCDVGADGFTSPPKEGVLRIPPLNIRLWILTCELWVQWQAP
jgi:hypothetical protein